MPLGQCEAPPEPTPPAPEPTPPTPSEPMEQSSTSNFNEPREGLSKLFDGDIKSKGLTFGDMEIVFPNGTLRCVAQCNIIQFAGIAITEEGIEFVAANDTHRFPERHPVIVEWHGDDKTTIWEHFELDTAHGAKSVLKFVDTAPATPPAKPDPLSLEERIALLEQRMDLLEELL